MSLIEHSTQYTDVAMDTLKAIFTFCKIQNFWWSHIWWKMQYLCLFDYNGRTFGGKLFKFPYKFTDIFVLLLWKDMRDWSSQWMVLSGVN